MGQHRDSSTARIIPLLPAQPIASAATIRAAIGARHQRALEGLKALEAAGVVRKLSGRDWDQQYAAEEVFELVERYEARAVSTGGPRASGADRSSADLSRLREQPPHSQRAPDSSNSSDAN